MKNSPQKTKYLASIISALVLSCLLSLNLSAAPTSNLIVKVVKQYNNKPIPGREITVTDKANPTNTFTKVSDNTGSATFPDLVEGLTYTITVKGFYNNIITFDDFNKQFIHSTTNPIYICDMSSRDVYTVKPDVDIVFNIEKNTIERVLTTDNISNSKLTYIPQVFGIDSVKVIADGAFYKAGLNNIELPNRIKYIGKEAFFNNNFEKMTLPLTDYMYNKWESSNGELLSPGVTVTDLGAAYRAVFKDESLSPNPEEAPPGMEYFNSKNGFVDYIIDISYIKGASEFGFFLTDKSLFKHEVLNNKIQASSYQYDIEGGGKSLAVNQNLNSMITLNMDGKPTLFSNINGVVSMDGFPSNYPDGNFSNCSYTKDNFYYLGSEIGDGVAVYDGGNTSWNHISELKVILDIAFDELNQKYLFSIDETLLYDDLSTAIDLESSKGVENMCYVSSTNQIWLHNKYENRLYIYSPKTLPEMGVILEEETEKYNSVIQEVGYIKDIKYKSGPWGNVVCVAGEKGIACLHNNKEWKIYREGFREVISCIEILDNGTIWVGTLGAGLVAIYPEVKGELTATNTPGSLEVGFNANFASITTEAKYYFNFNDGNEITVPAPTGGAVSYTHTFEKPGTYKVYVTAESADGSTGNGSIYVTVTAEATPCAFADFTISDLGNGSISITNKSQVDGSPKYKWDLGDGTNSEEVNITNHTYADNGVYVIYLGVYNADKECYSETKREIEITGATGVNTVIRAAFSTIVKGDTVDFINSSTGDIGGYNWDFGDGYTSEMRSPRHIYKEAGVYEVRLVAYNDKTQQADKIYNTVEVKDETDNRCYISFTYMETPKVILGEVYLNVLFAAKTIGKAEEFFWDFGDGTYYRGNDTIVHRYKEPGTYEVTIQTKSSDLLIKDVAFNKYTAKVIVTPPEELINYKEYCNAYFSYYVNENTIVLKNESTAPAGSELKYTWDFGDGNYSYYPEVKHTYKQGGVYYVKLTVSGITPDDTKIIDTYTLPVRIGGEYIPIYKADFTYYSEGDTVYFSSTSSGEISRYFWDFGDGNGYSKEPKAMYEYKEPGYYKVLLRIYDEKTEKFDEIAKEVVVGTDASICKADFSYHVDSNGIVNFFSESIGTFDSYSWDFDDGTISNEENPRHVYKKSGYYIVVLSVKSRTLSNMHAVKKRVYIKPFTSQTDSVIPIDADFASNASTDTNAVKFEDRSLGDIVKWYWDFGDNSLPSYEQNPEHTYKESGFYNVCLTVRNERYQNTDCQLLSVGDITGQHTSHFTYFADKSSNIVHFNNLSAGDISTYSWDFGDEVTSAEETPSHTYSEKGYYAVCLTTTSTTSKVKRYCQDINITEENIDTCTYNCVWPGDANNNLEANHYDILTIGMNYGMEGPEREGASILWKGQTSQPWANYQIDSTNNMHGDCNGDGIINLDDTLAIRQNFAHSHSPNKEEFNKAGEWTLTAEIFEVPQAKGAATTRAVRSILSEPSDKAENAIYGFGYELELIGVDGLDWSGISVDYNGTFLSQTANDLITFFTTDETESTIYISLSKNDQQNVTTAGAVATIYLPFENVGGGANIEVIITSDGGIEADGTEVPIKGGTVSYNQDENTSDISTIEVYPNPNKGEFYISFINNSSEEMNVEIFDITGQVIMNKKYQTSIGFGNYQISIEDVMPGMYTVKVSTSDKSFIERFIIE